MRVSKRLCGLRRLLRRGGSAAAPRPLPPSELEPLEPRLLLSTTFTVDSLADDVDADGEVTLREAVEAANSDSGVGDAPAGSGADVIAFAGSLSGTINLGNDLAIHDALSIFGPGAGTLTLDRGGSGRVFDVDDASAGAIDVQISGLTLTGGGVAAVDNHETLTLEQSAVTANSSAGDGAGLRNAGTLELRSSEVSGNTASGHGGGIANTGSLTVTNSTISGNAADGSGSGIHNAGSATLTVQNSTLAANRADADGNGGAGGGLFNDGGTATLTSTIVADNLVGPSGSGQAGEIGGTGVQTDGSTHNLIADASTSGGLVDGRDENLVGVDPQLGPLQDNGGSTRTHALPGGSPAREAGVNPALLEADQRGLRHARFRGAAVDIGAFEARPELGGLDFTFDFTLDDPARGGHGFFDTEQKRDVLRFVGDQLAGRFADDLSAILPGGGDSWEAVFTDPASGEQTSVRDLAVATNEIYVFAGGRDLGGSLGRGGAGGFSFSGVSSSFADDVTARDEPGALESDSQKDDFGPWGGTVAFDSASTDWHFDLTVGGLEGTSQSDFPSVAYHELMHLMGFSQGVPSYNNLLDTDAQTFTGSAAAGAYDGSGDPPLRSSDDLSHWESDLTDNGLETAMDPALTNGDRKPPTTLDIAALDDVGWEAVDNAAGPRLLFAHDHRLIADGASDPIGFGAAQRGSAGPERTFTVMNFGDAVLSMDTVSVPDGFSVVEPLVGELSPKGADTFTVRMDTAEAGVHSGPITISNNDSSRSTFEAPIEGRVTGSFPDITAMRDDTDAWWTLASDGTSLTDQRFTPDGQAVLQDVLAADVNGDGRTDVIGQTAAGQWRAGISDGESFAFESFGDWADADQWASVVSGDFDGDGLADVAGRDASTGAWRVGISDGQAFSFADWQGGWDAAVAWADVQTGDLNGDGMADVVGRDPATGAWRAAVSQGGSFASQSHGLWGRSEWRNVYAADLDGDGRDDLIGRMGSTNEWRITRSTTSGPVVQRWDYWGGATWQHVRVADFTGDGMADMAGRKEGGGWWLAVSNGAGTTFSAWDVWANEDWAVVRTADLDGDGAQDLLGWAPDGNWHAGLATSVDTITNEAWGFWDPAVQRNPILVGNFASAPVSGSSGSTSDSLARASTLDDGGTLQQHNTSDASTTSFGELHPDRAARAYGLLPTHETSTEHALLGAEGDDAEPGDERRDALAEASKRNRQLLRVAG